jgi:hypothetical protein
MIKKKIFLFVVLLTIMLAMPVLAINCPEKCKLGTCCDTDTGLCGSCSKCSLDSDCWAIKSSCDYSCIDGVCTEIDEPSLKCVENLLLTAINSKEVCSSDISAIKEKASDIVDMMKSRITMFTSGTEYTIGDNAKIFARLLDGNSNPVNLANCNATVFYPNNTKFIDNQPLTFLEKGIYYYDLVTPSITGNYITIFDCIFPSSLFVENRTINTDITASNPTYLDSFYFDNSNNLTITDAWIYYSVTGNGIGAKNGYYFNGLYMANGSGITQNINITLNHSNFIFAENQQFSIIRTALSSVVNWVKLRVVYTYNNPITTIRGQDEIHVSSRLVCNITGMNVTSDINYTYFDNRFNQSYANEQNIYSLLGSFNVSVISRLIALQSSLDNLSIQIAGISLNTTDLKELIVSVNSTVTGMLSSVQSDIDSSRNTILDRIDYANTTIIDKITGVNLTIMTKLYLLQDDIANINVSIGSLNLTVVIPSVVNLTNESISDVSDEVIIKMLQNARILNERVVNFHNHQYCIDNSTLQHNVTYNYCAGINNCRQMEDIMNENCTYGCDYQRAECIPSPTARLEAVGIFIAIIVGVILFFRRYW